MNLGPNSVAQRGLGGYKVTVNPDGLQKVAIGVTIEWSDVPQVAGTNAAGTITLTGGPTGGTFTLSYGGQTTGNIAFNAAPDVVETALEALSTIGNGNVRIGGAAGAYTYEFVADMRRTPVTPITASGAGLTGGASPGVTVAETQAGTVDGPETLPGGVVAPAGERVLRAGTVIFRKNNGRYAPAASGTTLVRGECYVVERHHFQSIDSDQTGDVFDAGLVFRSRLRLGGANPSEANFLAAFPSIRLRRE